MIESDDPIMTLRRGADFPFRGRRSTPDILLPILRHVKSRSDGRLAFYLWLRSGRNKESICEVGVLPEELRPENLALSCRLQVVWHGGMCSVTVWHCGAGGDGDLKRSGLVNPRALDLYPAYDPFLGKYGEVSDSLFWEIL